MRRKGLRSAAALAIGGALVLGTFALTASNTVPATKAGDGAGAISGYAVSDVHYSLNTLDPSLIDSVTFTLDSAPKVGSTLKVKLDSGGSTWYACTNVTTAVTCVTTAPPASVSTADELRVVVAD